MRETKWKTNGKEWYDTHDNPRSWAKLWREKLGHEGRPVVTRMEAQSKSAEGQRRKPGEPRGRRQGRNTWRYQ